MQTQTPSADVCTTPYGIDAEAKKTIQALRKKLSRWELDHLRAHCAKLANELEEAQATIERLTAERDSAESWAEGWREDVDRLVTALEGAGQQVGLTQCGAVVALCTGPGIVVPAQALAQQAEDTEVDWCTRLLECTTPGSSYTLQVLMDLLQLPNSPAGESLLRRLLKANGFVETRAPYTVSGRLFTRAPSDQGPLECQSAHQSTPGTQSSRPHACHHQEQIPEHLTPCSQPQAAQPAQTASHQSNFASPPPGYVKVESLATEGGAA